MYAPATVHTDLVFSASLTLTSAELLERKKDEEGENSGLFFIPATRVGVENLIQRTLFAATEVALANLLLIGQHLQVEAEKYTRGFESSGHWFGTVYSQLQDMALQTLPRDSLEIYQHFEKRDIARFQEMVKNRESSS